ncbi:flavodoxin [Rhizocola hellebori]|uniref:Flavodoxin n=1 Tax=Rhizocola hellebori TaxID=1392758 RepID=A0A8J3QC60_9ACTN|nr:flavodoxin [Rhizocola hellebori]GIH07891.1 flavodoxin [Rhizocola hellebori]
MTALIIYESMFGNTRRIAEAIADGLAPHQRVELREVGQAPIPLPADLDLLIIGAPTHALGMSRPNTRQSAAQQATAGLVSAGIGVREWLDRLLPGSHLVPAAAFDTKFGKPSWLPGSAARGIAKRLKRLGHLRAAMPKSFYVTATKGPLAEGELTRAREWGDLLGQTHPAGHYFTPLG